MRFACAALAVAVVAACGPRPPTGGTVPYGTAVRDEKFFFEDAVKKLPADRDIGLLARQQLALARSRTVQGRALQGIGWGSLALGMIQSL